MKCGELIEILNRQSPVQYALDWDNVGLLVGRSTKEVNRILLAVDATREVCDYAIANQFDMIVTHHPMIFSKINRVNDTTVLGSKILDLCEAGICCFAMHTNFDTKGGMGRYAANMLGLKNQEVLEETCDQEGIGQIGFLDAPMSLAELAKLVKEVFQIESVAVFGDLTAEVEKIAICPGSGKSEIGEAVRKGAQCLITGDIGHHEGIDAMEMGLTILDASHYGIEKIFLTFMKSYLMDYCQDLYIEVMDTGVPFTVV